MTRPRQPLLAVLVLAAPAALAGPGDGIRAGRMTLRPYVDASINYDSNARRLNETVAEPASETEPAADPSADPADPVLREESDVYYEARVGSSLLWFDDEWAITGSAWAFLRRYRDLDLEDEEGFGERFGLARGERDRLALQVYQSFERRYDFTLDDLEEGPSSPGLSLDAPDPLASSAESIDLEDELIRVQSQRDLLNFGIDAGRTLRRIHELDVSYAYSQTEYQDEDLFGSSQQSGSFSLGRRLSSKTTAFASGTYGEEDNDNYIEAVPYYRLLAGLRSATSEKLSFNLGVGYQQYDTAEARPRLLEDGTTVLNDGTQILEDGTVVPPEPRRNPVTGELIEEPPIDDSQGGLAYNAGLIWRPTRKLSFALSGRNEYSSTSQGNQREVKLAHFSAGYTPSEPLRLSVRAGYRDEQAVNPTLTIEEDGTETRINEEREIFTAGGRIGFRPPRKWYEVYADLTYEDIQSTIELDSYDRLRLGAGFRATY